MKAQQGELLDRAGELIGMLRSFVLSGESMDEDAELEISAWFKAARELIQHAPRSPALREIAVDIARQAIYDLWKNSKKSFGTAGMQRLVREFIHNAVGEAEHAPRKPTMYERCAECGFPYGEHARDELRSENALGWIWQEHACPIGDGPFHPTKVFRQAPDPSSSVGQEADVVWCCQYHADGGSYADACIGGPIEITRRAESSAPTLPSSSGQEAETKWISVEERLPDAHGKFWVWAIRANGEQTNGATYWYPDVKEFSQLEDQSFMQPPRITHWMPLPTPPSSSLVPQKEKNG